MTEQWTSQGKSFFKAGQRKVSNNGIEKNECDGINTIMYIKKFEFKIFKNLNLTSIQLHKVNHSRTNGPINPHLTIAQV